MFREILEPSFQSRNRLCVLTLTLRAIATSYCKPMLDHPRSHERRRLFKVENAVKVGNRAAIVPCPHLPLCDPMEAQQAHPRQPLQQDIAAICPSFRCFRAGANGQGASNAVTSELLRDDRPEEIGIPARRAEGPAGTLAPLTRFSRFGIPLSGLATARHQRYLCTHPT